MPLIVQDRVIGVMDLESEPRRLLHRRSCAHAGAAGAAGGQQRGERAPVRGGGAREQRMEEDLKAARELQRVLLPDARPEIEGLDAAVRLRPAREISGDIYDIFEHPDGQTVIAFGDCQRQRRRRGALRRPDERPAAHAGAAPPPSRRVDEGAQRRPDRAQGGGALRDAVRAAVGPRHAPDRDGQRRRHSAHDLPRQRDPQAARGRRAARACWRAGSTKR